MKKILLISIILYCVGCDKKNNDISPYQTSYNGNRITRTIYEDYDNGLVITKTKYDTSICSLKLIENSSLWTANEYNANNIFVCKWPDIEINNVGDIFIYGTDTLGFGTIFSDSLTMKITYRYPFPSDGDNSTGDTLFFVHHYFLKK